MNKNNFLKYFALFFTLVILPAAAAAQSIGAISYVPVKQGYYEKISTKSKAQFAADKDSVAFKYLKANSSNLTITTTTASFGKPIAVKGNVFVRPTSKDKAAMTAKLLRLQGNAYAQGVVVATKAPSLTTVVARDLNLQNRVIRLSASSDIIVDGVPFPSPSSSCTDGLEWRLVKAKNTSDVLGEYNVLACKGTGSNPTCTAPQADIDRCNNNGDTWKTADCCCSGTTELVFLDATMCTGSNIICNTDNTITSAAAVCNEFAADSAECICAQGNLKLCTPKVYGGGSDEAGCVRGEYHEACNCAYFIEFQSNFRNYACTGIPAKCEGGTTTKTCSASLRPISTTDCSPCGTKTRTVTCDTSTGNWVTGAWSVCDTTGCTGVGACCCGSGTEISNISGADCSTYNYTPKLAPCVCATMECDPDTAALCSDCGGTWNATKCTCDCGYYGGNACTFVLGAGCKCGSVYRSCI